MWGAGVCDAQHADAFLARDAVVRIDGAALDSAIDHICVVRESAGPRPADDNVAGVRHGVPDAAEEIMRQGLSSVSWSKVVVSWRSAHTVLPVAHNRLVALRRSGWRRSFEWIERAHEGRPIMRGLSQYLLGLEETWVQRCSEAESASHLESGASAQN